MATGPNNVKIGINPSLWVWGGATIAVLIFLLKDVTTRVNHRLASPIVLLTFLTTVAFSRAAARRDIEEYKPMPFATPGFHDE